MIGGMVRIAIACVLVILAIVANGMWISAFIANPPDHPWAEIIKIVLVHIIGILFAIGICRRSD